MNVVSHVNVVSYMNVISVDEWSL